MPDQFALPFTLASTGDFSVVEQNSDHEIEAAIEVVLRSRIGTRDDAPGFGINDQTFLQGGADLEALRDALATLEPRAERLISRDPALLAAIVDRVQITAPRED